MCKVLADNNDLSMNELLAKADVTLDQYVSALQVSTKGSVSVVILTRKPNECNINNYNASVMLAWQASMDMYSVHVCPQCLCLCHVRSLIHNEN